MLAYVLSMFALIPKVIKTLKEINPQIVILNYPSVYTGVLGFLAAKSLRKRCVVDFNDLIAQYTINLLGLEKSRFVSLIVIMIQDFIVRHSAQVIAPTSFIRDYALRRRVKGQNVFVLPNGVDFRVFDYRKQSGCKSGLNSNHEKVCLYFGRLDEWAGMQILKEVSSIFVQKHPEVKFMVVGGGEWKQRFPSNVTMIEEVQYHKVPEIISMASVILIPFPKNEVSHAASPLKLFEAMAMQKPIIASRVSGICEVIRDGYNGLLVDPEKPEEWIEAIEAVLDSKSLQSKLGRNALESAKEYDWDILASRFERILLTTAQRKKADA